VTIAVAIAAPYALPAVFGGGGFFVTVGIGATAGFAGGVVGTKLNGGSWNQAFKNGLRGAVVGAISAGTAYGVAEWTGAVFNVDAHSSSFFNPGKGGYGVATMKALAHGTSRALIAKAQGQNESAGFWSGFSSSGFAATEEMGAIKGTMVTATVSGTVSEMTGGKFANGAMTGAFIHLFNDYADSYASKIAFGNRKDDKLFSSVANKKFITEASATAGAADTALRKLNIPPAQRICADTVIFGAALIYHAGGGHGSWTNHTVPDYTNDVLNILPDGNEGK